MMAPRKPSFLTRLQSNVILPIGRTLFVIGAFGCLVGIVGGLLGSGFLTMKMQEMPDQVPVPSAEVQQTFNLELSPIDRLMQAPANVRFISTIGHIDRPLTQADVLGYFAADTPNGLTKYPDDFSILGGEQADMVRRIPLSRGQRSGLAPSDKFIERINELREILSADDKAAIKIVVAARDIYGRYSDPREIEFQLTFGPTPPQEPAETKNEAASTAAPARRLTPLEELVHGIAIRIDPEEGDRYAAANKRAMDAPRRCGANPNDPTFLASYTRAFGYAKDRIDQTTVEPFYIGLCESWNRLVAQNREAAQAARDKRNAAIRQNQSLESENLLMKAATFAMREVTLYVAGVSFLSFLAIVVGLATLANENHAKRQREMAEAAARAAVRAYAAENGQGANEGRNDG